MYRIPSSLPALLALFRCSRAACDFDTSARCEYRIQRIYNEIFEPLAPLAGDPLPTASTVAGGAGGVE